MDGVEGDLDDICRANCFRAYRALAMYNLGEHQQGLDGMLATFARMKIALANQPDFYEAKRLFLFSSSNYILMKIRLGDPQMALEFANEVPKVFPAVDPWTAQLLIAVSNAAMGNTKGAMALLHETPGEEIQSMLWPDRMTVVVAAMCQKAVSQDQTISTDERVQLANEYLLLASDELEKARQHGFFRSPIQREYLFKSPEVVSIREQSDFRLDPP